MQVSHRLMTSIIMEYRQDLVYILHLYIVNAIPGGQISKFFDEVV